MNAVEQNYLQMPTRSVFLFFRQTPKWYSTFYISLYYYYIYIIYR